MDQNKEQIEKIPKTTQKDSFCIGLISGLIIGGASSLMGGKEVQNLEYILIAGLGSVLGNQITGKYSSLGNRINSGTANYAGATAGQMIFYIIKNYLE